MRQKFYMNTTRAYLRTCHHHPVVEAQMQNSFAVMNECVCHFAGFDIPNTNGGVAGPADDDFVVVLQAQYGTRVPGEDLRMNLIFIIAFVDENDKV